MAVLLGSQKKQEPIVHELTFGYHLPPSSAYPGGSGLASLAEVAGDYERAIDHDPSEYFFTDEEQEAAAAPVDAAEAPAPPAPPQLEDGSAQDAQRFAVLETEGQPVPVPNR